MTEEPPTNALVPQVRVALNLPHPELGRAIHAVIDRVAARHTQEVRTQLSSAAALDQSDARDDLPEVLEALALALGEGRLEQLALRGPAHASAREGQRFSIEELFSEYILVRQSLRALVVEHLQRTLHDDEEMALQVGLDGLVAATVTSFTAQRETRLKLECNALRDFLSSLAHDLRNEINGVMTSLQLLNQASADVLQALGDAADPALVKKLKDLFADIGDSRNSMESSVSAMTRLLEIERLQTLVHLKVRDVALLPLMQGIVRSASRGLRDDGGVDPRQAREAVTITCPDDLIVCTDPDLLGTALVNLVGNAIKHAPGSPIRFAATALSNNRCRIEVRDDGPGIAPDRIPKLFERFERGDGRTLGAGLGLFVAHRAAELLGSPIAVASELGNGSCFSIELPPRPPGTHRAS